jgi:serine phosphatase RsbU (regulator of sigma subunit)
MGTFYQTENDKITILSQQPENTAPKLKYRYNDITFYYSAMWYIQPEKTLYSYKMEGYRDEWSAWTEETKKEFNNLSNGSYTFHIKAKNIYGLESNIASYSFVILAPWYKTITAIIMYIIVGVTLFFLIIKIYTRRLIAEKERLEKIVTKRTAEVVAQKEEIEKQHEQISEQNEQIKSSINYASKIQQAVLPPKETIDRVLKDYFILYLPRDIVSGDFYWITERKGVIYYAVADCTGHGVPGGFMSMMGMSFLNEIVGKNRKLSAGEILDNLRDNIINSLHQTGRIGENKDGMDIALVIIDPETNQAQFAGANNPLILIRDNELISYKSDKMPIGIYFKAVPFTTHLFEIKKGDVLYTYSDGYVDQFGGPDTRKFMSKNFKELLLKIHQLPMPEQREILHTTLIEWIGSLDRIDDVAVMGYRY